MQLQATSINVSLNDALPLQQHKVVLVVDLMESVRLMASNEASVVERWQAEERHMNDRRDQRESDERAQRKFDRS